MRDSVSFTFKVDICVVLFELEKSVFRSAQQISLSLSLLAAVVVGSALFYILAKIC